MVAKNRRIELEDNASDCKVRRRGEYQLTRVAADTPWRNCIRRRNWYLGSAKSCSIRLESMTEQIQVLVTEDEKDLR
jgi:hypothetical protein